MGSLERFIVGVLIVIYASHFLQDSYQRHHFHTISSEALNILNMCDCYCRIQTARKAVAVLLFTGGLTLLFESSICISIGVQAFFVLLQILKLRSCGCLGIYQNIFIHTLLLVILLQNRKERKAEKAKEKEARRKEKQAEGVESSPQKNEVKTTTTAKAKEEPVYPRRKK